MEYPHLLELNGYNIKYLLDERRWNIKIYLVELKDERRGQRPWSDIF